MEKTVVRIGILGCGAVAYRWYLRGLCQKNDRYSVVVVCDKEEARAKKAATEFDVQNSCTSLQEILQYNLDIVVVLTRHLDHSNHIRFFLNNKIHVYSEKPFVSKETEGLELLQLAKDNNLILASAPQIMLSTRNQKVRELIRSGTIGKVTLVRASCSNLGPAGRADTDYDPEWFYKEGGSLSSLGIYGLSALLWIFGFPKRVAAYEGIAIPQREVRFGPVTGKKFSVEAPDNVMALFDYGDGFFASFDGSYSVIAPPKYEFEIQGTTGALMVGGFGGPSSIVSVSANGETHEIGPDDDCHKRWNLAWGVEDLVEAICQKRPPQASAEFALQVIRVMHLMSKSSETNTIISL